MIPMTVPAKAGHQYLTERCVYSRCVGDRSDDTLCEATMYKNILLAIDLNDETSCRKPLLSAIETAQLVIRLVAERRTQRDTIPREIDRLARSWPYRTWSKCD